MVLWSTAVNGELRFADHRRVSLIEWEQIQRKRRAATDAT